ncbi:MAG: DivIVA domain-containing protein [Defluviitaleaceae bacterium]|nr:DivIVA domain-containing protein [Defluviitaleaceae bacterium]
MSGRFNHVRKGGYDPTEVEAYINHLEAQLKTYREKDATINQAIVSAQAAADNIIQNAKNQGRSIRENVAKQLEDVSMSITTQKLLLSNFVKDYTAIMEKYLRVIDDDDFKGISEKVESMEAYLRNFSQEVHEDLQIEKRTSQAQADKKNAKETEKNA